MDHHLKDFTAEKKLLLALNLYHSAKELKKASLKKLHPEMTEKEIQKKVILPDSQIFALENFLHRKLSISKEKFISNIDVTTAQLQIAKHLGCNPIILVGVDLCFEKHKYHSKDIKYAENDNQTVQIKKEDRIIYTQKDFLMSKKYIEEFVRKNKDVKIYNGSQNSILEELEKKTLNDFLKELGEIESSLDLNDCSVDINNSSDLLKSIHSELNSLKDQIESYFVALNNSQIDMELSKIKNSFLYELLLKPFWNILKNVILKTVVDDPIHIHVNEVIFYKNLVDLHLNILIKSL